MNRRGFMGFLAGGAVAGPAVAQEALVGLSSPGVLASAVPSADRAVGINAASSGSRMLSRTAALARVTNDPTLMAMVRKLAEQRIGSITALDPDLAANRSFSLATKLRLQRERAIEHNLRQMLDEEEQPIWRKLFDMGIDL